MHKYLVLLTFAFSLSANAKDITWNYYGSDAASTKFSKANLITPANVKNLKVVWDAPSIDRPILEKTKLNPFSNESTPVMIDGKLYFNTQLSQVVALDAQSGEKLWSFDPFVYQLGYPAGLGFYQRGVLYWAKGNKKRIFAQTASGRLYSLDAVSGNLDDKFADQGMLDLTQGLSKPALRERFGNTSPAIVCGKTLIVGSAINDFGVTSENPRGDVRGFDPETGALKWTFHNIPQEGEFGVETWKFDSWKRTGHANAWAPLTADLEANLVYLPVGTSANDFYGGDRKGDNLYGESLVTLDCDTGQRKWHFQMVHHGLWDYDLPASPVLFDVKKNGQTFKGVAQVTKQGWVYVFDRITGTPAWPIVETPVPQTDVPGEESSPTQPIPQKPAAFDRQGVTEDELINFTPELREEALKIVNKFKYGPVYTPSSIQGTITVPGFWGGASWSGAAYSPVTGKLYVPSVTLPAMNQLMPSPAGEGYIRNILTTRIDGPQGLPLFKPPYGRITAIDMVSGDHAWMKPIGRGPKDHPALKDAQLPEEDLGWPRRIHVLATPSLVFAAQEGTLTATGFENKGLTVLYSFKNEEAFLRALDPETGKMIAEIPLPANAFGAPMTYVVKGRQYIAIPYGGGNIPAGIMALSL